MDRQLEQDHLVSDAASNGNLNYEPNKDGEANPDSILTVYSFDKNSARYSYSSFVTKLHFRLRYAGIPYQNAFGSKFKAPKGKIPYIKLKDSGDLKDLSAHLDPKKRATDLALRRAVEEGGYFLTLYEHWYENYYRMRDAGPFATLPWGIRHLVTVMAYQYARMMLYMQGTGRYTAEEVTSLRGEMIGMLALFAEASRTSVSRQDGEEETEPFWILGGQKPTEADFTVFGYLAGLVGTVTQPATTALIKTHPALVEYIVRIHHGYFPDFELGDLGVVGKLHVE